MKIFIFNSRFIFKLSFLVAVVLVLAVLLIEPIRLRASDPPQISNVLIDEVDEVSAVIRWVTDKEAESLIDYGLNRNYGQVRDPGANKLEHQLKLDNLLSGTTYHFRVVSRDVDGNQAVSGDFRFTTEGDPEIVDSSLSPAERIAQILDNVDQVQDIEDIREQLEQRLQEIADELVIIGRPDVQVGVDSAAVRWNTNRPADSRVEFESQTVFDPVGGFYSRSQSAEPGSRMEHEVVLTGLTPATTYHFRVVSADSLGIETSSGDHTFRTDALAPAIQNLQLISLGEDFAVLEWSTSVPAESVVEYQNLETGEIRTQGSPTLSTNHSVRLSSLDFQVTYEAKAIAIGEDGGVDESAPIFFETEINEDPPIVSNVSTESTLFPGAESRVQTIVTWETDQLAVCRLNYQQGLAPGVDVFEIEPRDGSFMINHVQVVVDFRPATVYQFWMICDDRFGNQGQSETFVVFTPQQEKNIIDIIIENFEGTFGWLRDIF